MMRRYCSWFAMGVLFVAMLSCSSKQKSYTDMLNDEKKAIKQLIVDENLEILRDFPANYQFADNQFVELDNGVYINVIDSGNGRRAEKFSTVILARFTANRIMYENAVVSNYGPHSNGLRPMDFKYGYTTVLSSPLTEFEYYDIFPLVSEGMQTGLEYVGENGKVKLIVPFKIGSSTDISAGNPVYFEILEYKFLD